MIEFLQYSNFIDNKYRAIYIRIIERALADNRMYDPLVHEKHHILPQSLGGTEMTILTFKEHYICHELLTRFSKGRDRSKMTFALHTFFHFNYSRNLNFSGKLYDAHKKGYIKACKERLPSYKSDKFIFKNKQTQQTVIMTRADFKIYSKLTPQEINHLVSRTTKLDLSRRMVIKNWGVWLPDIDRFSCDVPRSPLKLSRKKITCEVCQKKATKNNYVRWHGQKCKQL